MVFMILVVSIFSMHLLRTLTLINANVIGKIFAIRSLGSHTAVSVEHDLKRDSLGIVRFRLCSQNGMLTDRLWEVQVEMYCGLHVTSRDLC